MMLAIRYPALGEGGGDADLSLVTINYNLTTRNYSRKTPAQYHMSVLAKNFFFNHIGLHMNIY